MATPNYLGAGQPSADSGAGLLGRIGSYFGGVGTPAYIGKGQSVPNVGGLFQPATPAYAAPAVTDPIATGAEVAQAAEAQEAVACPIDPEALASGHIAIVIPRER